MKKFLCVLPVLAILLCGCNHTDASFYEQIDQPGCFYNEATMTYELPGIPWKQNLEKTATALQVEWLTQSDFDYANEVEYCGLESSIDPITIFELPYGTAFNIYHGKCYAVQFYSKLTDSMSFEESCSYAKNMYEKFCVEYGIENLATTADETSVELSAWGSVNAIWESKNAKGIRSQLYFHTHTINSNATDEPEIYLWIGLIYDKDYLDSEWGFTDYSIDDYMN